MEGMKIIRNPPRRAWKALCARPELAVDHLESAVASIMDQVRSGGDRALIRLTEQFDKVSLGDLRVPEEEIVKARELVGRDLKKAIGLAISNIEKFHEAQRREPMEIETMPGVRCWRTAVPVEKVGVYIPGGSAPLFSTVLMLGIPAKLAGCREIILCTPPDRTGSVDPAILFAASEIGIKQVFRIGGAQAIAAMTFGTESIPAVYKIFGPGNQYVTRAKQLATNHGVSIDMPAGPSEVLVMADETAVPSFVAADLLSQAEHGVDSQVMLVISETVDPEVIRKEVLNQLTALPRKAIAEGALINSSIVVFDDWNVALDFVNEYAPEHLIINTVNASGVAARVINAGSVFIGNFTPEAAGDYASGTNHTLPTNGYARAFAGVSLESFTKYITFQEITAQGLQNIGPAIEQMAAAEMLEGHKQAIRIRLNRINSKP